MRTLMDKINHFESLQSQTVKDFNEVFSSKLRDVPDYLEVTIGGLADSSTTRFLTVGSLIVKHDFVQQSAAEIAEYEKRKEREEQENKDA